MSAEQTEQNQEDRAWVSVELPFTEQQLKEFCQDVELLFRINPYIEFEFWKNLGEGRHEAAGKNTSQEQDFDFKFTIDTEELSDGLRVSYDENSLKKTTLFTIESDPAGSKLTITDDYGVLSDKEKEERLHEVDRSLVTWAKDIRSYIYSWNKWQKYRVYRWYMRRVWRPLKPMARRIVYMILWITVVELALIALGAGVYLVEYSGLFPQWAGKF